jgi:hypothetical protein
LEGVWCSELFPIALYHAAALPDYCEPICWDIKELPLLLGI